MLVCGCSDSMVAPIYKLGRNFFCLFSGSPGFDWWFSLASVFMYVVWKLRDIQASQHVFLLSPYMCFIIGFICALCVARNDSWMSWTTKYMFLPLWKLILPSFWERVAYSACNLFILWLLNCIFFFIFPFGVGGLVSWYQFLSSLIYLNCNDGLTLQLFGENLFSVTSVKCVRLRFAIQK